VQKWGVAWWHGGRASDLGSIRLMGKHCCVTTSGNIHILKRNGRLFDRYGQQAMSVEVRVVSSVDALLKALKDRRRTSRWQSRERATYLHSNAQTTSSPIVVIITRDQTPLNWQQRKRQKKCWRKPEYEWMSDYSSLQHQY